MMRRRTHPVHRVFGRRLHHAGETMRCCKGAQLLHGRHGRMARNIALVGKQYDGECTLSPWDTTEVIHCIFPYQYLFHVKRPGKVYYKKNSFSPCRLRVNTRRILWELQHEQPPAAQHHGRLQENIHHCILKRTLQGGWWVIVWLQALHWVGRLLLHQPSAQCRDAA